MENSELKFLRLKVGSHKGGRTGPRTIKDSDGEQRRKAANKSVI